MNTTKFAQLVTFIASFALLNLYVAHAVCVKPLQRDREGKTETNTSSTDVVYEKKGEYSHIISSGTNCFTFACDPNPNKTCYCYDKVNKVATLDPGGEDEAVINYVVSVEYVGTFTNPITGAEADVYKVTTEPQ